MKRIQESVKQLFIDAMDIYITLMKIMIPAVIIVKALDYIGVVKWFGLLIAPVMKWVGLPASMGIVWATTMLTNIYTGMVVFFNLSGQVSLSVAQVTVLGTMLLLAHSLPVEVSIAKRAGVQPAATLLIRIGGALILGGCLNLIYQHWNVLQSPNHFIWQPKQVDSSLLTWGIEQLKTLMMVFVIVFLLVLLLRILRYLGIEAWLNRLLSPVLRLIGVGPYASSITIIGITLGLSYGGGLLIKETQSGRLSPKDIFLSMGFLALCHSLIEDTLLIAVLGSHLSGIFWARLIFAIIFIGLLARLPRWKRESQCEVIG